MRYLLFIILSIFSFSIAAAKKAPENPLNKLTFLISQIQDGDAFYQDLFAGTKKFRDEGYIQEVQIVNYHNSQEELEKAFDQALATSDAIITDLLGINQVEHFAKLAYDKGIPLVFAFVKPSERILDTYPNISYIAQDELQSGVTQGLLVSQYLNKHPEVDKNKDNIINIFNVAGVGYDMGDEWQRFRWQINTINNYPGNIFKAKEILNFPAFYNHDTAFNYVKELIAKNTQINDIEVIIAQSDNMAQGVVEALAGTQYQNIPIFSRGRTPTGDKYILEGKIIGTIQSSPVLIGYYACRLAYNYFNHLDINTNIPYLVYKKKIELPYEIVKKEDLLKIEGNNTL